jgi:hypothetical protein
MILETEKGKENQIKTNVDMEGHLSTKSEQDVPLVSSDALLTWSGESLSVLKLVSN